MALCNTILTKLINRHTVCKGVICDRPSRRGKMEMYNEHSFCVFSHELIIFLYEKTKAPEIFYIQQF